MRLNFDATTVDPISSFDPIPQGWYVAEIQESEGRDTKAGTGSYLQLTFKIIEGEHTGRLVWDRLNLHNQNSTAVDIAKKTLSAICHATGVMNVSDSSELHAKPMKIKVTVRPADGSYDASNEIKGYEPLDSRVTSIKEAAPAAQPQKNRPW